jgi:hypothetical protein
MTCPLRYIRQKRVRKFTSLVTKLPSSSGRPSKRYAPTLLQTNSNSTLRVLLDEVGKLPDYIKKRLCWLGDSFRMYLRDTAIIQHQHVDSLLAALQEVMDLIAALPKDVIPLSSMTEVTDDPDMHKYADKMD